MIEGILYMRRGEVEEKINILNIIFAIIVAVYIL
jgi:hypothetical protein